MHDGGILEENNRGFGTPYHATERDGHDRKEKTSNSLYIQCRITTVHAYRPTCHIPMEH